MRVSFLKFVSARGTKARFKSRSRHKQETLAASLINNDWRMNRLSFYLCVSILLFGCSGTATTDKTLMNFENTATVTEDSCRRWDRAVTSFTIQYPPNY